jgi:hypothetical protein
MRPSRLQSGSYEAGLRLRRLKPGQARGPNRLVPWWVRAMRRAGAAQAIRRQPKISLNGGGAAGHRPRASMRPYGRRSVVKGFVSQQPGQRFVGQARALSRARSRAA